MSIQNDYAAALKELAQIMADLQTARSCCDKLLALGAAQQKRAEKAEAALAVAVKALEKYARGEVLAVKHILAEIQQMQGDNKRQ